MSATPHPPHTYIYVPGEAPPVSLAICDLGLCPSDQTQRWRDANLSVINVSGIRPFNHTEYELFTCTWVAWQLAVHEGRHKVADEMYHRLRTRDWYPS